jgi:lipopolysaccharide/colanic/teichoic acid biosynthesis glycosyltransferase
MQQPGIEAATTSPTNSVIMVGKRLTTIQPLRDALLVLLVSPLLLPLAVATGIGVGLRLGRPVLFLQERLGRNGVPFRIAKFRSMSDARDASGALLPDAQRLDAFGRAIRRFRVDELPAFFQILSGRIALVGPRPLPASSIDIHPLGRLRLAVKPGFTGLAQISGNTLLDPAEKFAIDCLYAAHQSLAGDVRILFMTVVTILRGERRDEAVIAEARTTFPDFFGGDETR